MRVRAIDNNRDWLFGKGRNNYVTDTDGVAQSVATRLRSFLGDAFFAQTEGIDWFNLLGGKDQTAISLAVSATILRTTDVTALNNFNLRLDRVTRLITISYEVSTIFGDTTQSIEIGI